MSINPSTLFPGKIDNTDLGNYPHGKAQNITTPSDGTGTPWVADLLNDLFGFQQAILDEYSTVPSGTPDTIAISQYLDNIKRIAEDKSRLRPVTVGTASINVTSTRHNEYITVTGGPAVTITAFAATAPFGDTVTFDKDPASGTVDFVGDAGVTIITISGGTFDLTTDGEVATLVSINATTWKLIK